MVKGTIILLNGVSSSGKTTLSKELIKQLPNYFALGIDKFDGIIEHMEDRKNGRLIPVSTEHYFHRMIALFSDSGINLVVDQVLHDAFTTHDCLEVLEHYPVFFVGVHCPLREAERREQTRGDRSIGQAKKQLEYVHLQNEQYAVEVDTYKESIQSCAARIKERLLNGKGFSAWQKTVKLHQKRAQL